MKKNIKNFLLLFCLVAALIQCSSKGDAVIETMYGTYEFKTYTVDTFRFKVILNGETLTDSLLSPQGRFTSIVKFFGPAGRLLIVDAKNNEQVILDSAITMTIGTTTISIVQLEKGRRPAPPPVPIEPPPAAGNYKARFQYIRPDNPIVPFFDTVRVVVFANSSSGYVPIDTIDLGRNAVTPFYENAVGDFLRIALYNNTDFTRLHNNTYVATKTINGLPGKFSTWAFYGRDATNTPGRYLFDYFEAY